MTEEDFWGYEPIQNPLRGSEWQSSFEGGLAECMFETYGEELDFVENYDPSNIWTMIEEDGVLSLSSGKLTVNRIGYFVTEIPCHEDINIVLE